MTSIVQFTVRGMRNGSPVFVTWSAGRLAGDPPTVDLLEVEADIAAVAAGDFAMDAGAALLADPASAYRLCGAVIDRVLDVDPPDLAERLADAGEPDPHPAP